MRSTLMPGGKMHLHHALRVAMLLAAGACSNRTAATVQASQPCDAAKTQLELTACHAALAQRADSTMTERLTVARRRLESRGTADRDRLVAAQQTWDAYREAHCAAASGLYSDGSLAPMVAADCRARLANERAAELKTVYLDSLPE